MTIEVTTPEDVKDKMLYQLRNGKAKGTTTHIQEIDQCWTWRKLEANIISGYSNQGKSIFLRFLCLIKALEDNWQFIFNSPEDGPSENFFDDMVSMLCGQSTDKDSFKQVPEKMYLHCLDLIKDKFRFVYIKPPDNTVENNIKELNKLYAIKPFDAFIWDPLMKFQKSPLAPDRDDLYATYVTTLLTDFCRTKNVCAHLVIHQLHAA